MDLFGGEPENDALVVMTDDSGQQWLYDQQSDKLMTREEGVKDSNVRTQLLTGGEQFYEGMAALGEWAAAQPYGMPDTSGISTKLPTAKTPDLPIYDSPIPKSNMKLPSDIGLDTVLLSPEATKDFRLLVPGSSSGFMKAIPATIDENLLWGSKVGIWDSVKQVLNMGPAPVGIKGWMPIIDAASGVFASVLAGAYKPFEEPLVGQEFSDKTKAELRRRPRQNRDDIQQGIDTWISAIAKLLG